CCHLGLPAVYVPLPGTSGDEQTANARLVESAGGCVVLPQADLTPERLAALVGELLGDPARLTGIGGRARAVAIPDAAERLADLVIKSAGRRDSSGY
ncbi:MAG TPA: glycosyltransferase, partial [Solirubrobacteraceae bacterium]